MPHAKDPLLNKLPPHHIEAEVSLISSILIDNSTLDDIVDILSPEDFYRSAHRKIFSAIVELFKNGEPVDLVTASDVFWLDGTRCLREVSVGFLRSECSENLV